MKEIKEEEQSNSQTKNTEEKQKDETPMIERLIERSPESARIILFASNSFVSDVVLRLA